MPKITVEVSAVTMRLLRTLGTPKDVVAQLIDHAAQGVYRPGAWERQWLEQAFGDGFQQHLEPGDPFNRADGAQFFQRPKSEIA